MSTMSWGCPEGVIAPPWQSICDRTTLNSKIDYFFTDTGKELPEVYEFLVKLEGFLSRPITAIEP